MEMFLAAGIWDLLGWLEWLGVIWLVCLFIALIWIFTDFGKFLIQDGDKIYTAHVCPIHNPECFATYRVIVPVSECDVCNGKR